MLYSNKSTEDLENLNELVSLQSLVKASRLQVKLGKQNVHEDMKKLFELVSKSFSDFCEDVTKTMMVASEENNNALANLNNKLSNIMNDRGSFASYLVSALSKIINPEHTSQYKLEKVPDFYRMDDLLINKTIPVTLCGNLLTFLDTDELFRLEAEFFKMMTERTTMLTLLNYRL